MDRKFDKNSEENALKHQLLLKQNVAHCNKETKHNDIKQESKY